MTKRTRNYPSRWGDSRDTAQSWIYPVLNSIMMLWQDIPGWSTYSSTFFSLQGRTWENLHRTWEKCLCWVGFTASHLTQRAEGSGTSYPKPVKTKKAVSSWPKRISSFCGQTSRRLFLPRGWGKLRGFWRAEPAHSCWAWMKQSNRSEERMLSTAVSGGVQQAEQKSDAAKKLMPCVKKAFLWPGLAKQLSLLGLGLGVFLCTSLIGILTALSEISVLSLMENLFVSMTGLW